MIAGARYGHANLIAKDWKALSRFYRDLFGCVPVPPVRDFKGPDLERGTGPSGAQLRGEHLRLPGHGPDGATLEIFKALGKQLTRVYVTDPEGNVLELQSRPK